MNEEHIQEQFKMQDAKLDAIYEAVEKIRRYFLALVIISVVAFVLPLVGLLFAIPAFLSNYTQTLGL